MLRTKFLIATFLLVLATGCSDPSGIVAARVVSSIENNRPLALFEELSNELKAKVNARGSINKENLSEIPFGQKLRLEDRLAVSDDYVKYVYSLGKSESLWFELKREESELRVYQIEWARSTF